MKLHEVQSEAAARIAANTSLAAFGAAVEYSPFLDVETIKSANATRIRNVGVCIEIGEPEAERIEDRAGRGVVATATFDVFVAESPKVTHSPTGKMLRKEVIEAVTVRIDAATTPFEFLRSDTAISEQGLVLHIISFSARVTIP